MYFDSMGKANTDAVAECVARYLKEHPVRYAVVATVTGYTAEIMLQALPGVALAAVTHVIGMRKNGEDEMEEGVREGLRQKGVRLVTAAHVLSGAERGISGAFGGTYPVEVMAQTLRMFGAGLKVAVECATMALDNGAVPYGEDVIAIGGTVRGADTAVVMRPAHAARIFETQIREILCKPRDFKVQLAARYT